MIRISVYDDNDLLRETLALIFSATPDLRLIGQYPTALEVVDTVLADAPDVILMDIDMPQRTGIEAVTLIRQQTIQPKILMLTVFEDIDRIFAALSAGAVGYLIKKTAADKLIEAIREIAAGGAVMTPSIALKVLNAFANQADLPKPALDSPVTNTPDSRQSLPLTSFELTPKEKAVLERLVEGDSYKLIAHHCGISMGTVRWHIVNIYDKLHVNSKSEAVAKALKSRLCF